MHSQLDARFFPLIFESISHAIFTIDSEGHITSFNRMAEQLTGYAGDEARRPCSTLFQSDRCRDNCPLKSSIDTGRPGDDQEVTIVTKSGRSLPIAISTAALLDEDGEVIGGVEMFRDLRLVTELRKTLHGTYKFEDIVSKNHTMQRSWSCFPSSPEVRALC